MIFMMTLDLDTTNFAFTTKVSEPIDKVPKLQLTMVLRLLAAVAGVAAVAAQCDMQQGISAGTTSFSINVPGLATSRSVQVYVPTSYNHSAPVPLHVSWHGLSNLCRLFVTNTGCECCSTAQIPFPHQHLLIHVIA